jgi:hypothetical protein
MSRLKNNLSSRGALVPIVTGVQGIDPFSFLL